MKQQPDPYGVGVKLAADWLKKGFIDAWFKWVEWLSLTTLLFIITYKTPGIFLKVIIGVPAVVSLLMVYFSAIACMENISYLFRKQDTEKRLYHRAIPFLLGVIAPSVAMYVIVIVILNSIGQ